MESPSIAEDIKNLKIKVDAGTDHLISQLFLTMTFSIPSLREQI